MAEAMIGLVIYAFVAIIMIGIGVSQLKSKTPVAFYSGEKPPKEETLTDVKAWNKKHGMMWVIYGVIMLLSYLVGIPIIDSVICVIPMVGGTIIPIIVMTWYHHQLCKKYMK